MKQTRKEILKRYYLKNKEEINKRGKIYREKNRDIINEKARIRHCKNKEKRKKYAKQYRSKNKIKIKTYREARKEIQSEYMKNYFIKNRDKIRNNSKKYYIKNQTKIIEQIKTYRELNKEKIQKCQKEYSRKKRESDIEGHRKYNREYAKVHGKKAEVKQKRNKYVNRKRIEDPHFKLKDLIRRRLLGALKGNSKRGSAVRDLGCSIELFKQYIELKFHDGMSWENHGVKGWHLDHIYPLSRVDLTNREELLKVLHYTNYQPLWYIDNIKKGNKI